MRSDDGIDRVVVISDDAVESGGAAGIALRSVRMLSERGLPVTILNGSRPPDRISPGVEVESLEAMNLMQGNRLAAAARGLFSLPAKRFVQDWIEANDTPRTVYHLHNWHKVLSPAVFLPLRPVASRLVMTAHDYFLVCPNGGQFHYPRGQVCDRVPLSIGCIAANCDRRHYAHKLWRVGRHAVRLAAVDLARTAAGVIAVHDGMLPYLARGGVAPARTVVLRNPVTPWRATRVEAERNRAVLFVGRLEKDKGVDILAAAARLSGATLRIVGDGPLAEDLRQTHPEVEMLGWRSPADIAELIADARLLVVPTRWRETFGLVSLEAAMSGLPVLVSRHALIAAEMAALGCAEACDPDDVNGLAASLTRLLRDDRRIRQMSEIGFRQARGLAPTPEAWCAALVELYRGRVMAAVPRAGASSEPLAAALAPRAR